MIALVLQIFMIYQPSTPTEHCRQTIIGLEMFSVFVQYLYNDGSEGVRCVDFTPHRGQPLVSFALASRNRSLCLGSIQDV